VASGAWKTRLWQPAVGTEGWINRFQHRIFGFRRWLFKQLIGTAGGRPQAVEKVARSVGKTPVRQVVGAHLQISDFVDHPTVRGQQADAVPTVVKGDVGARMEEDDVTSRVDGSAREGIWARATVGDVVQQPTPQINR